ncbi:MAG: MopE-related protein, partial [Bacteroidota bacterium]
MRTIYHLSAILLGCFVPFFLSSQCINDGDLAPSFSFDIPSGVTVTEIEIRVSNFTAFSECYTGSRVRSNSGIPEITFLGNDTYTVTETNITGPSTETIQIAADLSTLNFQPGDFLEFDWIVFIRATGTSGSTINYSDELGSEFFNATDVGSVAAGTNRVSGTINVTLSASFVNATFYPDNDGDGFGDNSAEGVIACASFSTCFTEGAFANNNDDCDDTNPNVNPDAEEIPDNGIDDNCDGRDSTNCVADSSMIMFSDESLVFNYCSGETASTVSFNNVIENQSANFFYVVTDADSIILDTITANVDSTFDLATLQEGDYMVYGLSYSDRLTNLMIGEKLSAITADKCVILSSNILSISIFRTDFVRLSSTICDGDSVMIGNSVYKTSGSYSDTLQNIHACDSIVNLDLTVNPVFSEDLQQSICQGDSVVIGNSVYKTTGSFVDTLQTILGCDSIINLDLTVNPVFAINLTEVICEGEIFTVGTSSYRTTGTFVDTLKSINNCDSIITLDLTVNPVFVEEFSQEICQGESVQIGTSTYTETGVYVDTLQTILGCDSIINLDLMVNPVFSEDLQQSICQGDSVVIGNSVYKTTGSFVDTLQTILGCDSIINLDLTVNPVFAINLTEVICEGEIFTVGTSSYRTTGTFVDTLKSINNCDSIITLDLTVNPVFVEEFSQEICQGESVQIGNSTYTETGVYIDTLQTVKGCDSIINLSLTVNPVFNETLDRVICTGDSVVVGTSVYKESGVFVDSLQTINGCDSVLTLNLTVNDVFEISLTEVICEGEIFMVGTSTYRATGVFVDSLLSVSGCDSIVTLNLTVNPVFVEEFSQEVCQGESVQIGNSTYTETGVYIDTLQTVQGCDSIINLSLTVNPVFNETLDRVICTGDSVVVGTSVYKESGVFVDSLQTLSGCDSV